MSSRKTLSSALMLCHFDYSCSAWYSGLSKLLKRKLQVAQNKVIRFELPKIKSLDYNPNCQGSISNTFYYSAIKDWNGLPDSIKSIKDNIKFKFEVKKFLQSQNVSEDQNIYMYF